MSALAMPTPRVLDNGVRASALLPTVHNMTGSPKSSRSPERRAGLGSPEGKAESSLQSCQDRFEVVISAEKMQRRAALADIASKIEGQQIIVEETSQRQNQVEAAVAALRDEIRQLAKSRDAGRGAATATVDQEQKQDLLELASSVQALHEEMDTFRGHAQCQAALVEETSAKQIEMVASVMELGQGIQEIAQTVVATEQRLRREIEESAAALEASAREEAANTSNQILEALQQTTVQLADSLATEREGRKQEVGTLSGRVDELCHSGLSTAAPSALPQEVEFLRSLVDEVRVDVTRLELSSKTPEGGDMPSEGGARQTQVESEIQRLSEQSSAFEAKIEEVKGDLLALKEVGDMLLTDLQERCAGADAARGPQLATMGEATSGAGSERSSIAVASGIQKDSSKAALPTFCEAGAFAWGVSATGPKAQDADDPGTPRMVRGAPRTHSRGADLRASKGATERSISPAARRPCGPDNLRSSCRSSNAGSASGFPIVAPPRGTVSASCMPTVGHGQRPMVRATSPGIMRRRQSPEACTRGSVNVEPGKLNGGVATAGGGLTVLQGARSGSFVAPAQAFGAPFGASFVAAAPTPIPTNQGMTQVQMGNAQVIGAGMAPLLQVHVTPNMHCR